MTFGYLDPVTTSAIMQVLLGALAVAGLGWQYIRKAFNAMFRRSVTVEETKPENAS